MKQDQKLIHPTRIRRIRTQGYLQQSDQEISALAFGNRFAYRLCTAILAIGVATANIPLLSVMMTIAFLGVVLPNHPFDYIYNHWLRHQLNKPKLPPRSKQLKFACTMATTMIGITIYLFANEMMLAGYLFGGHLIIVASLVSTIDYCIPSIVYNSIFRIKI